MEQKNLVPKRRFKEFQNAPAWEQRKWEDTVDISTNMVDPRTGLYDELPHIGPGNIESFTGKILDNVLKVKDSNLISGKFHFYKGDIIYGKINPQLGKYAIAPCEGLASADSYILNAKNGVVQNFLYSILQTKDFYKYSVSVSSRTGMPKINRDELNVYNYKVPEIEEQKKIGSFFVGLDNLITLHQRKLEKTKALKSAYLSEMFPAEGEREPKRRFAGFTDPWEQRRLGDVAEISAGGDIDKTKLSGFGKYPVIANALTNDGIIGYYENDFRIEAPAVTVTGRGDVGHAQARKTNFTPVVRLLSVKSKHDVDFLEHAINKHKVLVESTGVPQLTSPQLANYKIWFTSLEEEKKIGRFFCSLDNLITLHQRKLEKLQNLKKAYLNEMFV